MFAVTERLLLRPGWAEDAAALTAAIGDHQVVRNLARAPWPYTLGDAEAFLAREPDPVLPAFQICERRANRLVGGISLFRNATADVELGYWIAREEWGRGYATEAGRAVITLARESLRIERIVAGHFVDNPASGSVLHKLGFRPTGLVSTRYSLARGHEVPSVEFAHDAGERLPADDPAPLAA